MDEDNEAEHGDESNTPSDDICGDMMEEENPDKDGIDDAAYNKYIGAAVIMDFSGEGPRRARLRLCVGDLDGGKVGTYHQKTLMDIQ